MSLTQSTNNVQLITEKNMEIENEPKINENISPLILENSQILIETDNLVNLKSILTQKNKEELKFFGISEYYIKEISDKLISKYSKYFSKTFDQKNFVIPFDDFLLKHEINPIYRTKMVDWMITVFHSFNSNEGIIFNAVQIMDMYLSKTDDLLKIEDIHLIGITCIYLAYKNYDKLPIKTKKFINLVAHDNFDEKTIKKMKAKIIKKIDLNLLTPNIYELIQFLLYVLFIEHKETIQKLNLKKMLNILNNCSIWLATMCNHFEQYSSVSPIILSFSCIIIAYEMMKENCKSLNKDMKKFFEDWIKFLYVNIAKTPEIKNYIQKICKSIEITYNEFEKMNLKSLIQYHQLYFE